MTWSSSPSLLHTDLQSAISSSKPEDSWSSKMKGANTLQLVCSPEMRPVSTSVSAAISRKWFTKKSSSSRSMKKEEGKNYISKEECLTNFWFHFCSTGGPFILLKITTIDRKIEQRKLSQPRFIVQASLKDFWMLHIHSVPFFDVYFT